MPRWIVEYSGGKSSKLIDYLAPRHPYRFRLQVILKAEAVPTLADKALEHYGEEEKVYKSFADLLPPNISRDMKEVESNDESLLLNKEIQNQIAKHRWLESSWSEETWTSTDTDGTSAVCFCMAVRCGYTKQVQTMLEERPSLIGIVNPINGFPPLSTAVRKGDINMVKFLLTAGAEVDQPSFSGQTALHLAVLGRHLELLELLLEKGANVKARDINGLQVEHYAVDSCDLDMLRTVLDKGGDVHAQDFNGWTPLFRALCQGARTEMVVELVQRGSDPEIRDHAGLPLTSVARLLKNRHGRGRDSVLRLVDSHYPHEKAIANFTRLTKKIYNIHVVFK